MEQEELPDLSGCCVRAAEIEKRFKVKAIYERFWVVPLGCRVMYTY